MKLLNKILILVLILNLNTISAGPVNPPPPTLPPPGLGLDGGLIYFFMLSIVFVFVFFLK